MTVAEFIEWLKTQDQGATVQVVKHATEHGYYMQGGSALVVEFTPELSDYSDFRGNPWTKPDAPHYNQRFLLLGEHNG